ncbi:hypothetical protein CBER1_02779 [Cercospora berteroae]|uniref:BRCT domain-containing protein n=1 Tax=Cercospora berteroae TaxID=357750 RepID=A0A2S6CBW3_9PEZI|nr:hypothetical protein CBER1_02779 [Cercospora berteroae]
MAAPTDQLPLQGVVLCCTSLAQDVRTHLADMAIQMGAIHKLDLTSEVTHLIVGCITTPKYRYVAKERPDIKVLAPEFVESVRDAWIEGGEVEVHTFEEEHRLKTFAGLELCLTGFSDVAQRKELERVSQEQGAKWSADLTKQVTHLIAAKPEGAKYMHAKQWGITVVSLKWYEDSLMRGMALDESYFACEIPLEDQGVGAFRTMRKRTSLGKREREASGLTNASDEKGRKRLRKSASMRLGEQSQDLWQSMSQHEVHVDNTVVNAWNEMNDESQTLRDSIGPGSKPRPGNAVDPIQREPAERPKGLFSGIFILIHGFDPTKTEKLRTVVSANGATVVSTTGDLENAPANHHFKSQCLLVPHAQPTELPFLPPGTMLVTEWWVERCLHFKQELNPDQDSLSQPLQDKLISDFAGLVISSTGFNSVDLRMSAETINLMGAQYEEQLSSTTSVLICASAAMKKEKAFYASKHNIPVVRQEWLWDSLQAKTKQSFEPYRLDLSQYNFSQFSQSTNSPATSDNMGPRGARDQVRRDEEMMHSKRLSNTRKRQPTPSLVLKPTASNGARSTKASKSAGPFVLEDSDDEAVIVAHDDPPHAVLTKTEMPRPLREISSNKSADPPKPVPEAEKLDTDPVAKSPTRRDSPVKDVQKLTSDLAALVRHRIGSMGQDGSSEPQKRKHRPLGRNLSGTSLSNASSRNFPANSAMLSEGCEADGFAAPTKSESAPPGTQLGYDSPDAEAARIQMSEKMGVAVEENTGIRMASMGTVKDSESLHRSHMGAAAAAAAGGRTKARSRTKT